MQMLEQKVFLVLLLMLASPSLAQSETPKEKPPETQNQVVSEAPEQVQNESSQKTVKSTSDDLVQTLIENEAATLQAVESPLQSTPASTLTRRVAVYSFELQNVPVGIGQVVTDALLAEVRKMEGISAIGMEEITQMISLEAQKQMLGCEASESCLAQIAGALGVDELITGTLTELADGRVILIRRIDQRQAKVIEAVQKRLKIGSGEEFLLAIGPSVQELYTDRPYRPGTQPGVPDELVLRLNPPPIPSWFTRTMGWTGLGLAAAGGISYGATWLYHNNRTRDLKQGEIDSGQSASQTAQTGQNIETASQTFLITGVLFSAAFGALYALTDWEDTDDAQ